MKKRITVLGTGRMGAVLALAFQAHGHTVTVWNRTAAKAAPLAAKGIHVATSVEDAVADAEIVVGNLLDYATTLAVLSPAATAALRAGLFVQLATGTPRQAREMAAWARAKQIPYLDGAIMATPDFIGQPGCTVLYSGPSELFEPNVRALAALGGNTLHVGAEIGHASALDAAVLVVLWASLFGAWHAAAICEAEGFPLPALASTLAATMPVLDGSLKDTIARITERRFAGDPTSAATADTCLASVRVIQEISEEHGIHLGLSKALETIFSRAAAAGRGGDDVATVYQSMRG
ncbi:MAG: NAD(P)-dependent oxidoreductase [Labilithrix sp.]|nr:NAD(P)-dependent oxidoreductase [Labilithrix sp.]